MPRKGTRQTRAVDSRLVRATRQVRGRLICEGWRHDGPGDERARVGSGRPRGRAGGGASRRRAHARRRRMRRGRRHRRARRLAAGRLLAELCMGGLGHVEFAIAHDRRRGLVRRAGLDRPPGRVLHGLAIRRLGDQPRRILRDGLGPAARESASGEGAVRQARLRGAGRSRRPRARGPHAADR